MSNVRVLVVDDHEIVRMGLQKLLASQEGLDLVGLAANAEEAVALTEREHPDVVLMDLRLSGRSGIEACREITTRWPAVRVIMLTSYMDATLVSAAIEAGASGYLLKRVASTELLESIAAVAHGGVTLDPAAAASVIDRLRRLDRAVAATAFHGLSAREIEVLALLAEGRTNAQIAYALNLSEKTVANHITALFGKLGVTNRVEAATYAVRHHIEGVLSGEHGAE
jgi:two-component system, NarL family, response regulator DevR